MSLFIFLFSLSHASSLSSRAESLGDTVENFIVRSPEREREIDIIHKKIIQTNNKRKKRKKKEKENLSLSLPHAYHTKIDKAKSCVLLFINKMRFTSLTSSMVAVSLVPLLVQTADAKRWMYPKQCRNLKKNTDGKLFMGKDRKLDCTKYGASCTPYSFWPNVQNREDQETPPNDWMNQGKFDTSAFLPNNNIYGSQAYKSEGASDRWVLHGDDGAGIQPDCLGDILFFEWFDQEGVPGGECPKNTDNNHEVCHNFFHPGNKKYIHDYWGGWWRGYNNAEDAGFGGISWTDMGVSPAADGANWQTKGTKALETCWHEHDRQWIDGTKHTKAEHDYDSYFAGVLFPWICVEEKGWDFFSTKAWTGEWGKKCYHDNEPWNGREPGDDDREPNQNTRFLYCAKKLGWDHMDCDQIIYIVDDLTGTLTGSKLTNSFVLKPSTAAMKSTGNETLKKDINNTSMKKHGKKKKHGGKKKKSKKHGKKKKHGGKKKKSKKHGRKKQNQKKANSHAGNR